MTYPNHESDRNSAIQDKSYTAFLLRCWLEETDGEPDWRFTLVQLGDKRSKQGFASLDDVTAHLRGALAAHARTSERTVSSVENKAGE